MSQATEKSEKMALSVEQLTSEKKMLETQVSRDEGALSPVLQLVSQRADGVFMMMLRIRGDALSQNGCGHTHEVDVSHASFKHSCHLELIVPS